MKPSKNLVYILFILLFLYSGCCKKSTSTDFNKDKAFNISYESKSKLPDCYELDSILRDFDIELVDCPAGTFMMGSPLDEIGRDRDEFQHEITISKPFRIGKYEVTLKQFESIVGKSLSDSIGYYRGKMNKSKNNITGKTEVEDESEMEWKKKVMPCLCSWKEANEFCEKLNERFSGNIPKNYHFDLPTEAQWEYACRAGTSSAFNNGKNLTVESQSSNDNGFLDEKALDEVCWFSFNSKIVGKSKAETYSSVKEIGLKKPNAWGIYDMHGNVAEYCKDKYGPYTSKIKIDPYNDIGGHPVVRGGNYSSPSKNCRSASRVSASSLDFPLAGFRIVLVSND